MNAPRPAAEIDWQQLRDRLARARRATEESLGLPPERARAVMEERALALARVPPRPPDAAEVLEVVTFGLAGGRYAVETRHVREVVRCAALTAVPGAPDVLAGLVNLRGEVLAVFDVCRLLGLAGRAPAEPSRVIVLGGERAEFGVPADAVHEVTALLTGEVHEAPAPLAGRDGLRGVTARGLVILDGAALLRDGRLFIDESEEPTPSP
jgi:purine-binding chemotaxis protein CheW